MSSTPVNASWTSAPPGGGAEPPVVRIRPQRGWQGVDVGELWRYRELLYFLVWRDIKVRYKQTVIGAAWAILQPVATMAIFSVIFGRLAKIPSEGVPYPVFVYAGLLPWLLFSSAVTAASQSLITQAGLLTKIYLPRLFIPATGIGVSLTDFGLSFVVYLGLMAWFGYFPGLSVVVLPVLLVLAVVLALGTGILLSSITVSYRDFRIVVPFMMQIGMFLSPVVYPPTLVPEAYRWLLWLNPLTGIIGGFRSALLDQPFDWAAIGVAMAIAGVVLVVGVLNFRRAERRYADIA